MATVFPSAPDTTLQCELTEIEHPASSAITGPARSGTTLREIVGASFARRMGTYQWRTVVVTDTTPGRLDAQVRQGL